ncbi:hypothetical protein F3Y22_tig00111877pilonHSYRG00086 [Hibiscus syriacus]|uniref:Uncharacterized protein n=1 Tax=Hibiscus syriacus TaxID=106335 RepID=A0A6A2YB90_HIBSY|nr:hypothetical protein F3Y22_tig00111877pilonHSYRG00086 [Hibiscus syriacus]
MVFTPWNIKSKAEERIHDHAIHRRTDIHKHLSQTLLDFHLRAIFKHLRELMSRPGMFKREAIGYGPELETSRVSGKVGSHVGELEEAFMAVVGVEEADSDAGEG